jgi:helicase
MSEALDSRELLNPAQQAVVDRGLLSSGFNCVLQMPTGAGKTWLAERAMRDVLRSGGRAVYLTPLRAQADELLHRWRGTFGEKVVGVFTGAYGRPGRPYPLPFANARIMIMTPERLDACTRAWRRHWEWIPEVELLVVDEIHLLGDLGRGPRLEGAMGRLMRLNPFLRVLGLSATLGNRQELADWLDGVEFESNWRPIPLTWEIARFKKAQEKPLILVDHVRRCVDAGGLSLVFVQSRRRAERLASMLREEGLKAAHHHAGLETKARTEREKEYRDRELDVLVSTGTLEMGLNLPARQVVLYDLQRFDGWDFSPLPVWTVWQRAGRAGRVGLDTQGEVVLIAARWDGNANSYQRGVFEPIRSEVGSSRALAEQIVAEVASGLCRTKEHLERALQRSLAARQGQLDVSSATDEMVGAGMLEWRDTRAGPRLGATRLGRAAARHMLSPSTVMKMVAGLGAARAEDWTFLDLLLLLVSTDECQPLLPVDFEELHVLEVALAADRSVLLSSPQTAAAMLGAGGRRLLHVINTALAARRWTRTGDTDAVAEDHGCYPFEIRRLKESLGRLLQAAIDLEKGLREEETTPEDVPMSEEPTLRERLAALQRMVQGGLDEEVVTLTFVPGIGPTLARRLAEAGICDIEDLAGADVAELDPVRGVSAARAGEWVSIAENLVKRRSAWAFRDTRDKLSVIASEWPSQLDPYRLGRAKELVVARFDTTTWKVTGGSEPHLLRSNDNKLACDCADAAKGNRCKHELAVLISLEDQETLELVARLDGDRASGSRLDLTSLWFQRNRRGAA